MSDDTQSKKPTRQEIAAARDRAAHVIAGIFFDKFVDPNQQHFDPAAPETTNLWVLPVKRPYYGNRQFRMPNGETGKWLKYGSPHGKPGHVLLEHDDGSVAWHPNLNSPYWNIAPPH